MMLPFPTGSGPDPLTASAVTEAEALALVRAEVPYCPTCGAERGVTLGAISFDTKTGARGGIWFTSCGERCFDVVVGPAVPQPG